MNKKINNKGFTLVELLAVMVILISISLIAVASITSSLDRRDEKECEEQKELALNAAKIYFSLNDVIEVDVSTLISDEYIAQEKVDRITGGTIRVGDDGYSYSGICN